MTFKHAITVVLVVTLFCVAQSKYHAILVCQPLFVVAIDLVPGRLSGSGFAAEAGQSLGFRRLQMLFCGFRSRDSGREKFSSKLQHGFCTNPQCLGIRS